MLAKMIVERGLVEEVVKSCKIDIDCEIELESGDNFDQILYKRQYAYDTQAYLGPITTNQTEALEMVLQKNVKSILDIGSGSGYVAQWLIERNIDVTACEIDPFAIELCKARGIEKIFASSVFDITAKFDGAILFGGSIPVEYTTDLHGAITDFMTHLHCLIKPGGFLLTDLAYYELPVVSTDHRFKVVRIRFGSEASWTPYSHHIYPSPLELDLIMNRIGFLLEQRTFTDIGSTHNSLQQRHYSLWQSVVRD